MNAVVCRPSGRRPIPLTAELQGKTAQYSMVVRWNPGVLQDAASSVPAATMLRNSARISGFFSPR